MRYLTKILSLVAIALTLIFGSCAKEEGEKFSDIEKRALKAWMLKNRPELVENFQEEGAYYVEEIGRAHV